jgi:hypothetical protein
MAKFVLMLAVQRRITENGAELDSIKVLRDSKASDNGWKDHSMADFGKVSWERSMEEAARCGAGPYHLPMYRFEEFHIAEKRGQIMTTMLHPITLRGIHAALMPPLRSLLDTSSQKSGIEIGPLVGELIARTWTSASDLLGETLGEILWQFAGLQIPQVIPFGKCELDYVAQPVLV